MIDITLRYQASVFGDFVSIEPTPDIISKLLGMFRDKNLLPSTFHEIGRFVPSPSPRIALSSANGEFVINLATTRVDVEKNATDPTGSNLGTADDFVLETHVLLTRILEEFKKTGNRVALITDALLKKISNDDLSAVYTKVFQPIGYYQANPPFEWNSRSVAKVEANINGSAEQLNVITKVNRIQGRQILPQSTAPLDRIAIGFDINTISDNKDFRFSSDLIASFFEVANQIRNGILAELEGFLNV